MKTFFRIVTLLVVMTSYSLSDEVKKTIPPIVDAHWLEKRLDDKNLALIDLRTQEEYDKGHIKNAINIYFMNLFSEGFLMPGLAQLRELFGNAGIDKNTQVVAYDDGSFIWAARLYWILEALGHKDVAILNVGYGHKELQNLPISKEPTVAAKKEFVPQVDNTKIETKLGTLVAIGNKTIIDGRNELHYLGKESNAQRYGHIPTAQNYACTRNYEVSKDGNKIKDLKELAIVYKDIPKDKDIILYCDGGAEAALNYIVLQELGYKASVYDGSWIEWGNDSVVPIENPSERKE